MVPELSLEVRDWMVVEAISVQYVCTTKSATIQTAIVVFIRYTFEMLFLDGKKQKKIR
jgi:hypothetical protein